MRWRKTAGWAAVLIALAAVPVLADTMYARFSAPVRAERTLGAETLGTLSQGDAVQVTGREGSYYRVNYRGRAGWVYFNKLAGEKPEDVTGLLGGLGGEGIRLTELEAGGALRGLSPMAESYAKAADVPRWAVDAVEAMQGRTITARQLEEFQREGGLGEYGEGVAP
ncbi:MAG: hypothetical protein AMK73_06420 [Planctomycetes bacterium SM23_32]|nr:MAG: hypothetical protein AMK73_06420 [Planctomycetes bacterium SM23_32]